VVLHQETHTLLANCSLDYIFKNKPLKQFIIINITFIFIYIIFLNPYFTFINFFLMICKLLLIIYVLSLQHATYVPTEIIYSYQSIYSAARNQSFGLALRKQEISNQEKI